MPIEFCRWPSGEEYLWVKTNYLEEIVKYVNKNGVKCLAINKHFGFAGNNLDFLSQVTSVTHLSIETGIKDITGLYSLKKCKVLWIADAVQHSMDFSLMSSLRNLGFYWNKNIKNLEKCDFLKVLNIIQFSFECDSLAALKQLEELTVNQPKKLTDLRFLKGYEKLKRFHLFYGRTLTDITHLRNVKSTLQDLEFDKCPSIDDWSVLGQLKELGKLKISASGSIPTLKWVKLLPSLKMLTFMDTDIEDGNLDFCVGLNYVGFNNKKKYNRTFEELNPDWDK